MTLREKIARLVEPYAGWGGLETSVNTKWQQEAYAKADSILALIKLACDCQHPQTTKNGFAAVSVDCPFHGDLGSTLSTTP